MKIRVLSKSGVQVGFEEFRLSIAVQTLTRELRKMGYRKLSARPRHHAQAEGAIEDFKKHFQPAWRKSRAKKAVRSHLGGVCSTLGASRPKIALSF
jgi:hypothetical protein